MIQNQTYLKVSDNSGAKEIQCIQILDNKKTAQVGDIIIGVVKKAIPHSSIKRSDIVRAVIVRTLYYTKRSNGLNLRFNENAAIIINKESNPIGTRIFGPIPKEIREKGYAKIISLSPEVI